MTKTHQIGVVGSEVCTPAAYQTAYDAGRRVAECGHILVTGGLGGVMEGAARGAWEAGGLTVGLLPGGRTDSNPYNSVVIATGMGKARNAILALSVDGLVVVQGATGTLSEMCFAYETIPIVAVTPSGGTAGRFAGTFLDSREIRRVEAAESGTAAVDLILQLLTT